MRLAKSDPALFLRVLLILGRASNLPTVWSNCLAGWMLSGGRGMAGLVLAGIGTSLIYAGGMFLNDAFDVKFDQQHRRQRPIPAGLIRESTVWQLGILWVLLGLVALASLGKATLIMSVLLVATVLLYDWVHKVVTFAPVLVALCRFWTYLIAGSASETGLTGLTVWSAIALACYVAGLGYIARAEAVQKAPSRKPVWLMGVPVLLALLVNSGWYFVCGLAVSAILALWIAWAMEFGTGAPLRNPQQCVSRLLAGIVWVDLLAVAGGSVLTALLFMGLVILALLLQRYTPAT